MSSICEPHLIAMIDPGTAVRIGPQGEIGVVRDYVVVNDHETLYLVQLLSGRHVEIEPQRVIPLNQIQHRSAD